MGLFKTIKTLRALKKQVKQVQGRAQTMQDRTLADQGFEPGIEGQLQQLGSMVGHLDAQLAAASMIEPDRERIIAGGLDGEATILSTSVPPRAARMFNLTIDLEVRVPGRDAYRVANDYMVSSSAQFGPGTVVPVKVDPADPAKVAIVWERAPQRPERGVIRPADEPR